jgi:hypothetical protein
MTGERQMKRIALFVLLFVVLGGALLAQETPKPVVGCLIVTGRGTRADESPAVLIFGGLASSARFDYVDSSRLSKYQPTYTLKELNKVRLSGVHIVVLEESHTPGELEMARKACEVTTP